MGSSKYVPQTLKRKSVGHEVNWCYPLEGSDLLVLSTCSDDSR